MMRRTTSAEALENVEYGLAIEYQSMTNLKKLKFAGVLNLLRQMQIFLFKPVRHK